MYTHTYMHTCMHTYVYIYVCVYIYAKLTKAGLSETRRGRWERALLHRPRRSYVMGLYVIVLFDFVDLYYVVLFVYVTVSHVYIHMHAHASRCYVATQNGTTQHTIVTATAQMAITMTIIRYSCIRHDN